MPYIKDYKYDIFLSYSHLDNLKVFGEEHGWVEEFYNDLNILLSRRIGITDAVKIWWDTNRLDGSILFDSSIEESVKQAAIMLCLVSPGYLKSEYCQNELQLFHKKAKRELIGLNLGNRSRILNVLLNNIPYAEWPDELSGTTGFPFHDAKSNEEFGNTFEINSKQFKNGLKNLREAIVKLIDEFPKGEILIPETEKKEFIIYFGDVADSLRSIRKRTITDLERQGYKSIYDVPPPFEEDKHENVVKEKLEEANLAVHLLDQYPGREIEGENIIWYPLRQAELSLQCAKPQLIWVPAEMNLEIVEDEQYKVFLRSLENGEQSSKNIKYIRGIKSELTQQIIDLAKKIGMEGQQPEQGKVSVLLDTHYDDQLYALELSKALAKNHVRPFINPQEDDPRKNINMLADRIKRVSKLIFLYGHVSKDWVLERMNAAKQLIISNKYPEKEFFIYMVPPHKDTNDISLNQGFFPVNVINNSDTSQLDPNALQQFLQSIKAVA